MKKNYYKYTDYHLEPAGLRRLDFVVQNALAHGKKLGKENKEIKVLDIGCGNGNFSRALGSENFNVLGIDIDEATVKNAKSLNQFKNVKFEKRTLEEITDKFDVIVANEIFEHIPDPWNFTKQVTKHLKPDGVVLISIPNGRSLEEQIRKFLNHSRFGKALKTPLKQTVIKHETVQSLAESPHLHFFSWRQFHNLLTDSGLEVVKRESMSVWFKQAFYIALRIILKRDSKIFRALDNFDNRLTNSSPLWLGDGWMVVAKQKK